MEDLDLPPLSLLQDRTYQLLSILADDSLDAASRRNAVKDFLLDDKISSLDLRLPPLDPSWTWLNTSSPLTEERHFRSRILVVDFFTYCCVNCLHVLPDLHRLERDHPPSEGRLLVVGAHSAKFDRERSDAAVADACQKFNISHPVFNDSRAEWWNSLGVSCWPTMLVMGPKKGGGLR